MITFDFEYYQPGSMAEAVQTFQNLDKRNIKPMYYGGGTEIISMGRMDNISIGAVIDIKLIPECQMLEFQGDYLIIGTGVTLTQIHEANYFPLLSLAAARVADHSIQNKITLGGNLCGTIIYREAVLPLLLADSDLVITGPEGTKTLPIDQVFRERMQLNRGDFIVQILIKRQHLAAPHVHVKRTKQDKINYPLMTICAMQSGSEVRTGFSGLCGFPFRSKTMEKELNNRLIPIEKRVDHALAAIPAPVLNDLEGSSEYRIFVLRVLLTSIINELGV